MSARKRTARPAGAATQSGANSTEDEPTEVGSKRRDTTLLTPTRAIARQATSAVAFVGPEPGADDPLLGFAPFIHKQPRRNSITPDKQRAFIAHLAATGIVSKAARHIGRSMEALYKLRARTGAEGFANAWDAAVERGVDHLEHSALARAIEGTPVWKAMPDGGMMSYGTRHNEALVMFFLRNRRPDKYAAHVPAGHPLYERIRAEILEEMSGAIRHRAELDELLARARGGACGGLGLGFGGPGRERGVGFGDQAESAGAKDERGGFCFPHAIRRAMSSLPAVAPGGRSPLRSAGRRPSSAAMPSGREWSGPRPADRKAKRPPRRCPTEGRNSTEDEPAEAGSKNKKLRPRTAAPPTRPDLYALRKSTRLFTLRVRHCGVGATSQ